MLKFTITNTISPALNRFERDLEIAAIKAVKDTRDIVTKLATTKFMRDFRPGELVPAVNRTGGIVLRRNETTILRRVTGRLAQSLIGASGGLQPAFVRASGNETIDELSVFPDRVSLTFGSRTPYAAIHEFGGVINTRNATINMPARSYFRPAIAEVKQSGVAGRLFDQCISELARSVGL